MSTLKTCIAAAGVILYAQGNVRGDPFGGIDLGGGWLFSEWFGYYNASSHPWVYHLEHEWQYATGESSDLYLYDLRTADWWFTSESAYPSFYSFGRGSWNWYFKETVNPREFVDLESGELWGFGTTPVHNVILRVVRVTPDWHSYNLAGGGFPAAVPIRESEFLKYFEVAIWEEIEAIHLYEFDNDFDPYLGLRSGKTPEEMTAHRESYVVKKVEGLPRAWSDARSLFLKETFADFTSYLVSRYPDSAHHLMYNGHGGPGGLLFEGQLSYEDANGMLAHWAAALGRPLGVIDMGGPCTKGSFSDLDNFCRHAIYYIASDIPNGGYTMDDWTIEKHWETEPESQYHRLFAETSTLQEALLGRIDIKRRNYEYSRINMMESRTQQANYLYSCEEFTYFSRAFKAFLSRARSTFSIRDDLYDYMISNGAGDELVKGFNDVIVHRADNKDFFQWEEIRNGMLMPSGR